MRSVTSVLKRIITCARSRVDNFELEILSILKEELSLTACSYYSLSPLSGSLSLRGQVGFRYRDYKSFTLDIDTPAGSVFREKRVMVYQNLIAEETYRDKILVQKYGLKSMVVVPIGRTGNDGYGIVSSICLYPKRKQDLENLRAVADDIRECIEVAIQFSMDHTFHLLRDAVVKEALFVTDPASFFHKALQHLKLWNFEASSVFMYDDRAKCLRLSATTGLAGSDLPKRNVFYRLTETESITVRSYIERSEGLIAKKEVIGRHPRYREWTKQGFHSAIVIPFFTPNFRNRDNLNEPSCLGVLRLTNRLITHNSRLETADFTWEDHEIIRFFLDVAGVVIHMFQRVVAKTNEFERVVHGLETSVLTILGALKNIEQFVDYKNIFPYELRYSIPNSVAFAESIHEQIKVFKLRGDDGLTKVEKTSTHLYGDIISKLRSYAVTTAKFHSVSYVKLDINAFHSANSNNVSKERFFEIPLVYTDSELLLSVFKNLIENSIKYSTEGTNCFIKIDWSHTDNFVDIRVSDNGIGVPEEDKEFIFNETYQAENAMRRRTSGAGIGLFQCNEIMEKLGGHIFFDGEIAKSRKLSTTFVVRIPRGYTP